MNIKLQQIKRCFENLNRLKIDGIYFSGIYGEGEYKDWHNNNELAIHCFYKEDNKIGEYKEWYYYGDLFKHCFYVIYNNKSLLNGKYYEYNNGDDFKFYCFYKFGEKNGEYKKIDTKSNLIIKHIFYKNNKSYSIEKAKILFPEGPWLDE